MFKFCFTDIVKPETIEVMERHMTLKMGSQIKEELLKSYIQRLNDGEDQKTVKNEFIKSFKHVLAQDIIDLGIDSSDVQKLCDLHSALFTVC